MNYFLKILKKIAVVVPNQGLEEVDLNKLRNTADQICDLGTSLYNVDDVQEENGLGMSQRTKPAWGEKVINSDVKGKIPRASEAQLNNFIRQMLWILNVHKKQIGRAFPDKAALLDFVPQTVTAKNPLYAFKRRGNFITLEKIGGPALRDWDRFKLVVARSGFPYNAEARTNAVTLDAFRNIDLPMVYAAMDEIGVDIEEPNLERLLSDRTPADVQLTTPTEEKKDLPMVQIKYQQEAGRTYNRTQVAKIYENLLFFLPQQRTSPELFRSIIGLMTQYKIGAVKNPSTGAWEKYRKFYGIAFPYQAFKQQANKLGFDVGPMPTQVKDTTSELGITEEDQAIRERIAASVGPNKVTVIRKQSDKKFIILYPNDQSVKNAITASKANPTPKIKGLLEDSKIHTFAKETYKLETVEELLQLFREYRPDWIIDTTAVDEAVEARDIAQQEFRKPIPEVTRLMNDNYKMHPHQNEGFRFLEKANGNAMLGDEPGVGKTIQSLAYAAANNQRALVVGINATKRKWLNDATKFFNKYYGKKDPNGKNALDMFKNSEVLELNADDLRAKRISAKDLINKKLVSVNFESFKKFLPIFQQMKDSGNGFDTIIVDESQNMKEPKAQQTKALLESRHLFDHHILLSGTPVLNKRMDYLTQLEMIAPGVFTKEMLKKMTPGDLNNALHKYVISRKKANVLKDLPPKVTQNLDIDMPEIPGMPEIKTIGEFSKYRSLLARAKVPYTYEFAKSIIDSSDENIVIFTESLPAANELHRMFEANPDTKGLALIHKGPMSKEEKERAKDDFQNIELPYRVFIAVRKSTAAGIDLFKASTVIFNDIPWNPGLIEQAEDRTHREGQKKSVNIYWVNAANHEWDNLLNHIVRKKFIVHKNGNKQENMTKEEWEYLNTRVKGEELVDGFMEKYKKDLAHMEEQSEQADTLQEENGYEQDTIDPNAPPLPPVQTRYKKKITFAAYFRFKSKW